MSLKRRDIAGPTVTGIFDGKVAGTAILPGTTEISDGVTHPIQFLGRFDVGGPWLMTRDSYTYGSIAVAKGGRHKGSQLAISGGPGSLSHPAPDSDAAMRTKGTTAIARSIPTNPAVSGLVILRETKSDGLPSMPGMASWEKRLKDLRSAGDEFLNVEFGWMPLLSDIHSFCHMVKDHTKIINDLKKGSGQTTRVGYHFPTDTSTTNWAGTCFLYRGDNSGVSSVVPATYIATQTKKSWFKGAFRYHLPVSDNGLDKMNLYSSYADKLLGLKPTPANLWASSPWTWGLDWFANYGDVLTNISQLGQNGLALFYGYMMTSVRTEETISVPQDLAPTAAFGGHTAGSRTRVREFKKRIPADPYGFGVSESSLSGTQKAILGALGLTKARGGPG